MKLKPLIKYNDHNLLINNSNDNKPKPTTTTPFNINNNKPTTPLGFTNHSLKYNDK